MQTSYGEPAAGRPGLIVKRDDADTLVNGESGTTAIPWGRAVQVISGKARVLDGTDDVIVGVIAFEHDYDRLHALSSSADGPLPGQPMTIVRDGVVWVPVEEAIAYGDRPFVRYAVDGAKTKIGAFSNASGTGKRSMQNQGMFVGASVTYSGALVAPLDLLMSAQPAVTDPAISASAATEYDATTAGAAGSTGEVSDAGHVHEMADALAAKMVHDATLSVGAEGGSSDITVTVQLKDAKGTNIAAKTPCRLVISDAALGAPSGTAPDGAVTIETGVAIKEVTTKVVWDVLTDASGVVAIKLIDSGTPTFYVNVLVGTYAEASAAVTFA